MPARLVDRPNRHREIGIREHADGNGDHVRHRRKFAEDCPAALRTEREDPFFPVIGDAYVFVAATFGAQLLRIEACLDAEDAAGSPLALKAVTNRNPNGIASRDQAKLSAAARCLVRGHPVDPKVCPSRLPSRSGSRSGASMGPPYPPKRAEIGQSAVRRDLTFYRGS